MLIVSQEKDGIFNFENIEGIRLMTSIEDNKRNIIAIDMTNGERYSISKYSTEGRAKEVLQEIASKYRQYNLDNNKAVTILPKVYEMPKE